MRWLRRMFLPASLAILVTAALTVPLPLFTERPGQLVSLSEYVALDAREATDVHGDFLLTAVSLRRATVAGVVRALVDDDVTLIRDTRLIPPGIDDRTYFQRQRAIFATTADVAAALGLRAAGYPVDPDELTGDGVLVVQTLPDSPAEGILESGDVIVGVGGDEVRTTADLVGAVTGQDSLSVRFTRDGREQTVELTPRLLEVEGARRPVIGVTIETLHPRIDLPIAVEIDSGRIGGPSAGLMIALTVMDKASTSRDLAAGRRVAGTGAIDEQGNVRPIGGIRQKIVSAYRSGADLFLVPEAQLDAALEVVPGDGMEIIGVASFDGAVQALISTAGRTAGGQERALAA